MRKFLTIEPAAFAALAAAVYALAQYLWLVFVDHTTTPDAAVIVALAAAVYTAYIRARVTPLARPRDRQGRALAPVAGEARQVL